MHTCCICAVLVCLWHTKGSLTCCRHTSTAHGESHRITLVKTLPHVHGRVTLVQRVLMELQVNKVHQDSRVTLETQDHVEIKEDL